MKKTLAQKEAAQRKFVTVEGVQFESGMADGMDAKQWAEFGRERFFVGAANQQALLSEAFKQLTAKPAAAEPAKPQP